MKKRFCKWVVVMVLSIACFSALAVGLAACGGEDNTGSQVTVTLKANGGTFTDGRSTVSVSVSPNSLIDGLVPYPVTDDYIFDGWTETENGTERWSLAEKPVKKNVTLYAVWAEKVTVTYFANGGKFNDENDAVEVEMKKSSAAKLPDAPERDGYAFGGWYHGSVTDSKVILAEGFASGTAVEADTAVYAKWAPETGKPLPKPSNLSVESDKISWDAVDGANGYRVIVLNSDKEELLSATATGEWYDYGFASLGEGAYTVKVRANGDGINYVNSGYASKNYEYKLTSLNVSFDIATSELFWESADGDLPSASTYDVEVSSVDGEGDPVYSEEGIEATSLDMSAYDAGEYSVKIISKKQNYTSVTTVATFTKLRLATPAVDVFAESEDGEFTTVKLSWNAVKHATHYIVTVGSKSISTASRTITITDGALNGSAASYDFTSANGIVAVRAFDGDCNYLVSLPGEAVVSSSSLVKITLSNEFSGQTASAVKIEGSLYKYSEPPYTVYFDCFSNLYIRYPDMNDNKNLYEFYLASNYSLSSSSNGRYIFSQTVTAQSGLTYPDYRPAASSMWSSGGKLLPAYISTGWYADRNCTVLFDFTAPVTGTTYVYCGWVQIEGQGNNQDNFYYHSSFDSDRTGIYYNDFTTAYKRTGTYGASTAADKIVYFTTRVAHQYDFKYKNAQSGNAYKNTIEIYNVTKNVEVKSLSTTSTEWTSYSFNGKVGDIFRITFSHGTTASDLSWEMGHDNGSTAWLRLPSGGKAGAPHFGKVSSSLSGEIYAVKGSLVTLTTTPYNGKTFLGWFDENDNKISEEYTYTFTASAEVAYKAKWSE